MKNFIRALALTLVMIPMLAFAQDAGVQPTETSTGGTELGDLIGSVGTIIEAFRVSVVAGIAAIFAALVGALNFGPLKDWLAASKFDWVRPLVMLLGTGFGAAVSASLGGADLVASIIAGVAVGLSSGYVQKLIQEAKD